MESFKINLFKKDFPNANPEISKVSAEKCEVKIYEKFGIDFLKGIQALTEKLAYIGNTESNSFKAQLKTSFFMSEKICLYNINYIECDKLDPMVLIEHFDYWWYPSSDDILIFSDASSRFYFIDHDGDVYAGNV